MQFLKSRPDESQVADSLRFLLAAMGALKKRNPLTESFLVQLDVDLEALGTRIPKLRAAFPRNMETSTVSLTQPSEATATRMLTVVPHRSGCMFHHKPKEEGMVTASWQLLRKTAAS